MNELDKQIIASVQADMPTCERPFQEIADNLGITEETLIERLTLLRDEGVIRRFGATLRHQESGFSSNAMVAWQVDEARIEKVGETFAAFREVSHCYRRNPAPGWPYNLYTMIHARDEASCRQIASKMARGASVDTYTLLFSRRELKKTSMKYFLSDDDV